MGGNISVDGTLGKDSLFRVELPVELDDATGVPIAKMAVGEVVGLPRDNRPTES